jgi:hypothetical protein
VVIRFEDAYVFTARVFQILVSNLPHLVSLWFEGVLAYAPNHPHMGALVLPARLQLFVCITDHIAATAADNADDEWCPIELESFELYPSQLHTFRVRTRRYFIVSESIWSAKLTGETVKETPVHRLRRLEVSVPPSTRKCLSAIMSLNALRHLTLRGLDYPEDIDCGVSRPHELERLELIGTHGVGRSYPTHLTSFLRTTLQSYDRLHDLRLTCHLYFMPTETILNIVAASPTVTTRTLCYLQLPAIPGPFLAPPVDPAQFARSIQKPPIVQDEWCDCTLHIIGTRCTECVCTKARRLCGPRCHGKRTPLTESIAYTSLLKTIAPKCCSQRTRITYTHARARTFWKMKRRIFMFMWMTCIIHIYVGSTTRALYVKTRCG